MTPTRKPYSIVLASASPRRQELLRSLGIDFSVCVIKDIAENYPEHLQGAEIPLFLAERKAEAYRDRLEADTLLITADTIVSVDGCTLGKPTDAEDAHRMLRLLSGKTHQVHTGVCLRTVTKQMSFSRTTDVTFAPLSDTEIDHYVASGSALDKAGAYGIQDWIGHIAVTGIQGSFFNVMGLPVQALWQALKKF
ncbi:MAG: Maf-like protein [Paludibacteraceae bacterium]|nr:Maf-like protein [Paludibacteraceae bacterium]